MSRAYILPFNNFLICVNCICTKLSQVKPYLVRFGLPQLPESDLLNYSRYLKRRELFNERPEYVDFYRFFVEHKVTKAFSRALAIQENPFLWRMVTASVFLRKKPEEIIHFCRIDQDVFQKFVFYFMDLKRMDLFDINHYISLLSDWDQQLLSAALDGDEPKVMWMLGQLPQIDASRIVQDIAVHAYYNYFKWSASDKVINNKMAKDYGELALKAVLGGKEFFAGKEVKYTLSYVFENLRASGKIVPVDKLPDLANMEVPDKKKH